MKNPCMAITVSLKQCLAECLDSWHNWPAGPACCSYLSAEGTRRTRALFDGFIQAERPVKLCEIMATQGFRLHPGACVNGDRQAFARCYVGLIALDRAHNSHKTLWISEWVFNWTRICQTLEVRRMPSTTQTKSRSAPEQVLKQARGYQALWAGG